MKEVLFVFPFIVALVCLALLGLLWLGGNLDLSRTVALLAGIAALLVATRYAYKLDTPLIIVPARS